MFHCDIAELVTPFKVQGNAGDKKLFANKFILVLATAGQNFDVDLDL